MSYRPLSSPAAWLVATIATTAFLLTALLQGLLALGILPITMAWGGSQPVLTMPIRLASLVAVVLLLAFAAVIRWRAGLTKRSRASRPIMALAWVIAGYMVLNTLGNLASASRGETLLFGPLSLTLAVCCLLVAASRLD